MVGEKIVINQGYSDINPLLCGREKCEKGHSFGPAIRDYILLHFVVSGKGVFSTSRGSYELGSNKIFVIRPNEITYYKADEIDPWEYIWIGFSASDTVKDIFCRKDVIFAPEMKSLFTESYEAPDSQVGKVGYEAFLAANLWHMLAMILNSVQETEIDANVYAKSAVDIMESEYSTGITVTEIAERLHLNRSYFSVIFKKYTGVSPAKYLIDIRMKRALFLMNDLGYSVSVTALSVGFADVFGFSRAFKKYYGKSPNLFNKNRK